MSNGTLNIEKVYLEELISYTSRSLCGKILKRFEILKDSEAIKSSAKELIYEEFRQLRDLIEAHDRGINIKRTKIEFTENPSTNE